MMFLEPPPSATTSPVIIGGTGGSGTRSLAGLFVRAGGYLGWDLNGAYDSLSLTPFLRGHMVESYNDFVKLSPEQIGRWKEEFANSISTHLLKYAGHDIWGWKNPTSMFLLPFFREYYPGLKFVHIVRDGRDMILSKNSNQYKLINDDDLFPDLQRKIIFWSESNLKVKEYGSVILKKNYYLLRFEDLCENPRKQIKSFLAFINSSASTDNCMQDVRKPDTIGRYKKLSSGEIERLTAAAKEALAEFGYV